DHGRAAADQDERGTGSQLHHRPTRARSRGRGGGGDGGRVLLNRRWLDDSGPDGGAARRRHGGGLGAEHARVPYLREVAVAGAKTVSARRKPAGRSTAMSQAGGRTSLTPR